MTPFLQNFTANLALHKDALSGFLNNLGKDAPLQLDAVAQNLQNEVWSGIDCLACSNCCRTMSPVFTPQDIKRIATNFRMTSAAFKQKWLYKNKAGQWMNRSQPCSFLDLQTNKCTIYALRPADCSGFPHLTKTKMIDYLHVHKQNIRFCPATFKMVGKLMQVLTKVEEASS